MKKTSNGWLNWTIDESEARVDVTVNIDLPDGRSASRSVVLSGNPALELIATICLIGAESGRTTSTSTSFPDPTAPARDEVLG